MNSGVDIGNPTNGGLKETHTLSNRIKAMQADILALSPKAPYIQRGVDITFEAQPLDNLRPEVSIKDFAAIFNQKQKLWQFGDSTTQVWDKNGYTCKTKKGKK